MFKKTFARGRVAVLAAVVSLGVTAAASAQTTPTGATAVENVFTAADLQNTSTTLITQVGGPAVVIMAAVAAFGAAWGLAGKARRIGR